MYWYYVNFDTSRMIKIKKLVIIFVHNKHHGWIVNLLTVSSLLLSSQENSHETEIGRQFMTNEDVSENAGLCAPFT